MSDVRKQYQYIANKGFNANPQNINRAGRAKGSISKFLEAAKEKGIVKVTKADVKESFEVLMGMTQEEFEEFGRRKDNNILLQTAYELLKNKATKLQVYQMLLDRSIGKTADVMEITHKTERYKIDDDGNLITDSETE